jgi:hypothetical protein
MPQKITELFSNFARSVSARQRKHELPKHVPQIVSRLEESVGEAIVSIVYYPHPCVTGGLLVVFSDDTEALIDKISIAHSVVPPYILLHCFKRSELFELAFPVITWLDAVNVHIQMPFWLKHRGVVIEGLDILDEIALPDPHPLLGVHIDICTHSIRNHVILGYLTRKDYLGLIKKLNWQAKCLMATALVPHNQWDIDSQTLPERFEQFYSDRSLGDTWQELSGTLYLTDVVDEASCRRSAFESVWLFESFLRRLRILDATHNC